MQPVPLNGSNMAIVAASFGRRYSEHVFDWEQALAQPTRHNTRYNFARNLDRLLTEKKIRNAKLASAMDVSKATIGRWRTGEAQPTFDDLDKLCGLLGVAVMELYLDPSDERTTGMDLKTALAMITDAIEKSAK